VVAPLGVRLIQGLSLQALKQMVLPGLGVLIHMEDWVMELLRIEVYQAPYQEMAPLGGRSVLEHSTAQQSNLTV
jgi:hypothetical protein